MTLEFQTINKNLMVLYEFGVLPPIYVKDNFARFDWIHQFLYSPKIIVPFCKDQAVVGGLIGGWVQLSLWTLRKAQKN